MTDFKPGDRVRVVNDCSISAYNGETGVVDTVADGDFWPIRVIFDKPVAERNGVAADIFDSAEIEIITKGESPAPADGELQALRERLLALAVKAYVDEAHQSIVETARMFENYITGGTK